MKALISPLELVASGVRIAQVETQEFEVAEPLYWIDCADDVNASTWYFNTETQQCDLIPIPVPTADENKATAVSLLQATDWTQIASVSDPALSNPYLANKLAFDQYRNAVRQYALYPEAGNITWPTLPVEDWVKV
jgi:hypothetical protein